MRAWSAAIGVMLALATWALPTLRLRRGAIRSVRATSRRKLPITHGCGRQTIRPSPPTMPSTSTARMSWEVQAARPTRKADLDNRRARPHERRRAWHERGLDVHRASRHDDHGAHLRTLYRPLPGSKNSSSPALRVDGSIVPGETCLDTVENEETCSVGGPPGTGGEQRGSRTSLRTNCRLALCVTARRTGMRYRGNAARRLGDDV